jgi:uncharacterized SAM-binding protein YcdF (DUF218 family)
MTETHAVRRAAAMIGVLALAWLAGFAWFLTLVPESVADPDSVTDAIVVLTGGSQRLESGLALLAAGKAKWLFVTGVHQGVAVSDLLRQSSAPADIRCCVVLGSQAENTIGNAAETASFMAKHDFHSLRLVTASYHMPRSLLDFARVMPRVRLVPNPVFPELMRGRRWWLKPAALALLAEEYVKYLFSLLIEPGAAAVGGTRAGAS